MRRKSVELSEGDPARDAFEALARDLVQVPKPELDERRKAEKAAKRKRQDDAPVNSA